MSEQTETRVSMVTFIADIETGAAVVSKVFASLPQPGEFDAWKSQQAAVEYCDNFPADRCDVGGYYTPCVDKELRDHGGYDGGLTSIITPSSRREVVYDRHSNAWTVEFGDQGSVNAAADLLAAISEAGCEIVDVSRFEQAIA